MKYMNEESDKMLGYCESCAYWLADEKTPHATAIMRTGFCSLFGGPAEQGDECSQWDLDELYEEQESEIGE